MMAIDLRGADDCGQVTVVPQQCGPWLWLARSCLALVAINALAALAHAADSSPAPSVSAALARPLTIEPAPAPPDPGDGIPATLPDPDPVLSPEATEAEIARLRLAYAHEVGAPASGIDGVGARALQAARDLLTTTGHALDRPQLLVVVDRNPHVQRLFLAAVSDNRPWELIGSARVSTGEPGRKDYYITPVGVFEHTDAILDYRAEGTYNENHVRGLGSKGMRVWDFGWQTARKGWRADGEAGDIRLLMHATDPDLLERRLGRAASKGCVRLPDAMNRFLDRHGVLDLDYERAARDDIRYRALLLPDRTPTPLRGDLLVVVDTSGAES